MSAKRDEMERIRWYLEKISQIPLLSSEEEKELAKKARNGDKYARDRLIKANLRFVVSVAMHFRGQGLPLEDLINEGNMGLIQAVERFDESRGVKFISYAVWWIKQTIFYALGTHSRTVRLPLNRTFTLNKILKAIDKIKTEQKREVTFEEIAKEIEKDSEFVQEILTTTRESLSLDKPFPRGDGNSLLNVIEDVSASVPDNQLMRESLSEELEHVFARFLNEREVEVIKLYYGINRERPLKLREIADIFGVSRERVRQIKKKALWKLRQKCATRLLRGYLS